MEVTVICFGLLRDRLPEAGRGPVSRQTEGSTVSDLISDMGLPAGKVVSVLVDGEQATTGQELHDGAEVTLMPAFSGGQKPPHHQPKGAEHDHRNE